MSDSASVLNLDDLSADDVKVIKIDGGEHRQVELTVEGYIARVRRSKSFNENAPRDEQIAEIVALLHEMFPTLAESRLRQLSMAKLNRLIEFALTAPRDIEAKVNAQAQVNAQASAQASAAGNG